MILLLVQHPRCWQSLTKGFPELVTTVSCLTLSLSSVNILSDLFELKLYLQAF